MKVGARIQEKLVYALHVCGVKDTSFPRLLELPSRLTNGDYATSVALQYAKQLGVVPRDFAQKIFETCGSIEGVEKIEIAEPGFLNFYLDQDELAWSVGAASVQDRWGTNETKKGKQVMVEYTDPNPFKEFHIGHLMSNAIGEAISRLIEISGARTVRANWQGDVGPHVAKAIWGKIQKPELSWGEAYTYGAQQYEAHKDAIDAINKQVYEKSDPQINALYEEGRSSSLTHFEDIYKTLGTKFDYYFFEGIEGMQGPAIVREYQKKGVFVESDGAIVFRGEDRGLHTRVFLTSKGLPTYEAKELGLNKTKFDKEPDLDQSIIVTAHEQSEYFKVVFKAMEQIFPDIAKKTMHIAHGMMRFADGKMSSRTGNVITGESLLDELILVSKGRAAESRAEDHDKLAEQVAVAAIKYQILKQASSKDIIFDRERALSLEGDSGPYLQYAHARACAIVEKAVEQKIEAITDARKIEGDLPRIIHRFPEVVEYAAGLLEPHIVTNYLIELAAAFNSWYAQVQILDGSPDVPHKVAIVDAVRNTLKNGLWTLGIPAPEKM